MSGVTIVKQDQKVFTLPGIPGSGGSSVTDYPIATDTVTRIHAVVSGAHVTTGHVDKAVSLFCQYAVKNNNGTVTAITAAASSTNPYNSNTAGLLAADVQAYDDNFSTCTAVWTISTTNARLTITNNGSITGDFVVFMQVWTSNTT